MLGPAQKAWLLEALRNSQATFKVLVSSVAWAPGAKPGSHDTWDGFPEERGEIFAAIEKHNIEGVLLLAADRHRSDAWKIERPSGYPLFEFMSSCLTNIHRHECFDDALFCYNDKCSWGAVRFETNQPEPQVTYEIFDIDGTLIHTHQVSRRELEFVKGER